MKVGYYVRTKYGIRKVIQIDNETTSKIRCYVLDKFYNECKICSSNYIYDEDIIKSSPNIINLIEVGDYVNGHKIFKKEEHQIRVEDRENTWGIAILDETDIKSIVTKEQFKSMKYEVK